MQMTRPQDFIEQATELESKGDMDGAIQVYEQAIREFTSEAALYFNLALIHKSKRNWQKCYDLNQKAAELDPADQPTWWNFATAATVLGDWRTAKKGWRIFGVNLPDNDDPIELNLGITPIRLSTNHEVVWSQRIDPARARIVNIPLPQSQRRYGDLVLNDGAPNGERVLEGLRYFVFDELQLLEKSTFRTFSFQTDEDEKWKMDVLESLCETYGYQTEDWRSSYRTLCKKCSEGVVHSDAEHDEDLQSVRDCRVALAAPDLKTAEQVLRDWARDASAGFSNLKLELE